MHHRVLERFAAALQLDAEDTERLKALFKRRIGAALDVMELEALQPGMVHPALVLHDPEDREMPVEESRELVARWPGKPGATLALVGGVGHRRIIRDPSVIQVAVDFITTAAATTQISHGLAETYG